jgi:hypothetical protein
VFCYAAEVSRFGCVDAALWWPFGLASLFPPLGSWLDVLAGGESVVLLFYPLCSGSFVWRLPYCLLVLVFGPAGCRVCYSVWCA